MARIAPEPGRAVPGSQALLELTYQINSARRHPRRVRGRLLGASSDGICEGEAWRGPPSYPLDALLGCLSTSVSLAGLGRAGPRGIWPGICRRGTGRARSGMIPFHSRDSLLEPGLERPHPPAPPPQPPTCPLHARATLQCQQGARTQETPWTQETGLLMSTCDSGDAQDLVTHGCPNAQGCAWTHMSLGAHEHM